MKCIRARMDGNAALSWCGERHVFANDLLPSVYAATRFKPPAAGDDFVPVCDACVEVIVKKLIAVSMPEISDEVNSLIDELGYELEELPPNVVHGQDGYAPEPIPAHGFVRYYIRCWRNNGFGYVCPVKGLEKTDWDMYAHAYSLCSHLKPLANEQCDSKIKWPAEWPPVWISTEVTDRGIRAKHTYCDKCFEELVLSVASMWENESSGVK